MSLSLFAASAPGLEALTRQELMVLGAGIHLSAGHRERLAEGEDSDGRQEGGVAFHAGLSGLYRANLHLRTASRVLLRLGQFPAASFPELRERAAALPWEEYLMAGQPVTLRVTCHKSRLYHSDAVAERVRAAIGDRLGRPVPPAEAPEGEVPHPAQLALVRIVHDRVTISLDSSGELLHRRGYRLAGAKAPLRETLAAGLLLASSWNGEVPLLDPFCGSGTIAIEAARLARGMAPGKERRFAFMSWPGFNAGVWKALLAEAVTQELPAGRAPILASDRDAGAVRDAQANARRAGVAEDIQFACQAFSAVQPPAGPGWVITNPPYGVRTHSSQDLRNLYAQLGEVLRSHCPGWQLGLLTSGEYLAGHTRLPLQVQLGLVNGGIPVKFFCGPVNG